MTVNIITPPLIPACLACSDHEPTKRSEKPDMIATHTIELRGCAPEPLMSYLKALGVFRLVARQKDAAARASWRGDVFVLQSTLDKAELGEFFLAEYCPSPIVSPWNGGSGFYPKDNAKALSIIDKQDSRRFRSWQEVIASSRQILSEAKEITKEKERKQHILTECRKRFPDDALDWLDTAYVLTGGGTKYPPLLGSGGNDGRLEFSNNFMQNVVLALNLEHQKGKANTARSHIRAALFAEGLPELVKSPSGLYNPGPPFTNPWDFVLMIEGALTFAGSAARRLSATASAKAAFPFTVNSTAAGYGTSVASEYGEAARAEFWAPVWDNPATFPEVEHLAAEGRAQLGRKQATSGSDFGRAVIGLGVERGVSQFRRYGFLVRNGRASLATPLGRFHTATRDADATARRANLLFDLDRWLERLRRAAAGKDAPARLATALSRIDGAIMEFCQQDRPLDLQEVLIATGRAHQWLAHSRITEKILPLNLSDGWLKYADDGSSVEFRLARAIASIQPGRKEARIAENGGKDNSGDYTSIQPGWKEARIAVGAVRENLEPIASAGKGVQWAKQSVSCVWTGEDVTAGMLAVLERRCRESLMTGLDYPPLSGRYPAELADIVAFLEGRTDDRRIAALALPLSFIRYEEPAAKVRQEDNVVLPCTYAAMKLVLPSQKIGLKDFSGGESEIRPEIRLPSLLRAGRVQEAYQVACRRLVASSLSPLSDMPGVPDRSAYGRRLAAALLFPIRTGAYQVLAEYALFPTNSRN